jgi:NAD(P)-dependent dehydrogenase (short-subunit alcohol dehydrogenase family)
MTQIADSVAFLTGSTRGLGAELVRQALARDARKAYATARYPCAVERLLPVAPVRQ